MTTAVKMVNGSVDKKDEIRLSAMKDLYAIFFSGEGVAIKVPVKNHRLKVLQRRSTEETEKVLSETTSYHWL